MVRHDPESLGGLLVLTVLLPGQLLELADDACEQRRVVDGLLAVQDAKDPLESHARVDVLLLQGRELALRVLEVLHEDVVPDLGELTAVAGGSAVRSAFGPAVVVEDLGVGSAGSGDPGGSPPVVLLAVEVDLVLPEPVAHPELCGLGVLGYVPLSLERGDGEVVGVHSQDLREEGVAEVDGLLLEVVPEGPVAEHLEEGQVACVPDLVDVPGPDALLEVHQPLAGGVFLAEEVGYQGVHPCCREENGGIVLGYEGCRTDVGVSPLLEEINVGFSHLLSVHDVHSLLMRVLITHL